MNVKCPQCNALSPQSNKFCGNCGVAFVVPQMVSAPKSYKSQTTLIIGLICVAIVFSGLAAIFAPDQKTGSSSARPTPEKRRVDPEAGPEPEQSSWDATVPVVDRYLRGTLNDYESAEYVEWSPLSIVKRNGKRYWIVRLKLRAKNAFGGYIVKDMFFFIQHEQVIFTEEL